jgi:hypothetical protein
VIEDSLQLIASLHIRAQAAGVNLDQEVRKEEEIRRAEEVRVI